MWNGKGVSHAAHGPTIAVPRSLCHTLVGQWEDMVGQRVSRRAVLRHGAIVEKYDMILYRPPFYSVLQFSTDYLKRLLMKKLLRMMGQF